MKRTDVHRPSALVTEDYDFFACGYKGSGGHPGYSPLATPAGKELLDEGWRMGGVSGGNCDHCGAFIIYYALLLHRPTKTIIRVGETCLDNRFARSTAEFQAMRKRAQLDREKQRIVARKAEWIAESPDHAKLIDWLAAQVEGGHHGYGGFYFSLLSKFNRYGDLSEKQVAAGLKAKARDENHAAEKAEREAAEPKPVPIPDEIKGERVVLTGIVLGTKVVDSDFGSTLKMLMRDDRGFKVWGTVPRELDDVKGTRVTFTAKVEASDDDPCFGFYSRPTKADYAAEWTGAQS